MSDKTGGEAVYCSSCDYAITKLERNASVIDFLCPRCKQIKISMFYSIGSDTHRMRMEDYVAGVSGNPPALPIAEREGQ